MPKKTLDDIFGNNSQESSISSRKTLDEIFGDSSLINNTQQYETDINKIIGNSQSQQEPSQSSGNPVLDFGSDIVRGGLAATSDAIGTIDGAAKLFSHMTQTESNQGDVLKLAQDRIKQFADTLPKSDSPLLENIGSGLGGVPIALAEFAGTGVGGIAARSAVIGGLNAYNKDENLGSLAAGAAIGGTVGLALDKIPGALARGAKIQSEQGDGAAHKYYKNILGLSKEDADLAVKNVRLSEKEGGFNLNPSKEVPDVATETHLASIDIDKMAKEHSDILKEEQSSLQRNYEEVSDNTKSAIFDLKESNKNIISSLKENKAETVSGIQQQGKNALEDLQAQSQIDIPKATLQFQDNISQAKNSLENELYTIFSNAHQNVSSIEKSAVDSITLAKEKTRELGLDNISLEVADKAIQDVIDRNLDKKFFEYPVSNSKSSFNIEDLKKLANTRKSLSLNTERTLRSSTGKLKDEIEQINKLRENLKENSVNGKVSLATLETNSNALEEMIQKQFSNGNGDFAKILSEIKQSINVTHLLDNPKFSSELKNLKLISQARKNFSSNIDNIRNALSMYTENIEGASNINFKSIFSKLESGDRPFIERLRKQDALLPPEQKILDKVLSAHKNYRTISRLEKEGLEKLQLETIAKRKLIRRKYDDIERKVKKDFSQKVSKEQTSISNRTFKYRQGSSQQLRDLYKQNKEALSTIRQAKEKEMEGLQKTIDDRLQFVRVQQAVRGVRPGSATPLRVANNYGQYSILRGVLGGHPGHIATGAGLSAITSPLIISNLIRGAGKTPTIKINSAVSSIVKKLIASKVVNR